MQHFQFINEKLKAKGAKAQYAKELGISHSFLTQIKTRHSKTPKRLWEKVVRQTNGEVSLLELINEELPKKTVPENSGSLKD